MIIKPTRYSPRGSDTRGDLIIETDIDGTVFVLPVSDNDPIGISGWDEYENARDIARLKQPFYSFRTAALDNNYFSIIWKKRKHGKHGILHCKQKIALDTFKSILTSIPIHNRFPPRQHELEN